MAVEQAPLAPARPQPDTKSTPKTKTVEAQSLNPTTPAVQPVVQPIVQPRLKAPEAPAPMQAAIPVPAPPAEAATPTVPATPPQPKVEQPKPKVVHIYGLEGGPKDIPLPGTQ
jgi:hypothetical protein